MKFLNALRGLGGEEVRLLFVLGGGSFLLMSNLSSINVALPQIQDDFGGSLSTIKWVSITGFIVAASLSLCFGRVGDIYGRRRVYRAGIAVYTAGSLLCALAPALPFLLGVRVLMAVGLAMASPLAGAIIAASVAPERRGQLMGLFMSFAAAGQLMGPTFGGFILDVASWRYIFIANGVLGLGLCVAQHFLLRGADERRDGALDLLGALLLLAAYPAFLVALSVGPSLGWASTRTLIWLGVAALGFVAFVARERSFQQPLVRFSLYRNLTFATAMLLLAVTAFVQNPITLFMPIYLQRVLQIDPFDVGLLMMSLPLSTLLAGPVGGYLADRYPSRLVAAAGMATLFVAVVGFSQLSASTVSLVILVPLVLTGVAGGLFRPANQVGVYSTVDRQDYGAVSAMMTSLMMLAGTLGTTVTVAISESLATGSDARSFAEAQQTTFLVLLPLLAAGIVVALLGAATGRERQPATATGVPVGETRA
jgi:EmrB/QacA subfamily drug resistance transporter